MKIEPKSTTNSKRKSTTAPNKKLTLDIDSTIWKNESGTYLTPKYD